MTNYRELLKYISPADCDYQQWVNVGMALHFEGEDCSIWDEWSERDAARYHPGECAKKWRSFGNGTTKVTGATIMQMAKDGGYEPNRVLAWDDEIWIDDNVVVSDAAYVEDAQIPFVPENWNPVHDLIEYMETIYEPDDIIGYCTQAQKDDDGKLKPCNAGVYGRKAKDILSKLKAGKSIEDVIGTIDAQAGAWIRFNPLDGKGVNNKNVTAYRYALVESDELPLGKQVAILREMRLPIAIMLYSGGKSIHAIVRVNAADYDEYVQRVAYLYKACENNKLIVDQVNKNPSRLSRMPGVMRKDRAQYIIDRNTGFNTWDEWFDWIEGISDDYPDFDNAFDLISNPPPLKEVIIDGMLRRSHKMIFTGPSKGGKSFGLIELCLAFATGDKWMGCQCKQGKTLYVNLELDRASCADRFAQVAQGEILDRQFAPDIWNLRGRATEIEKLAPKLLRRAKKKDYIAIILDPIYKLNPGDENSASEIANFCNALDKIAAELNAAVIFCHHHSKGGKGNISAVDRSSGSGVFARDPDAIIDMIEIEPKDVGLSLEPLQSAWRLTSVLREFPPLPPIDVIFDYPLHLVTDKLSDAKPKSGGDAKLNSDRGNRAKQEKRAEKIESVRNYILETIELTGKCKLQDVAIAMEVTDRSIRNYIKDMPEIEMNNGICTLSKVGTEIPL